MMRLFVVFLALLWATTTAAPAKDGILPGRPERVLKISPETTTWTSLDVRADGKVLVFDMLGDLFIMPAKGGAARQLTEGLAYDAQPVFSPDGKWIAFASDRNGSENLWVARADGSGARAISQFDDETSLVSPAWSADGNIVYASRFRPDVNGYELWQFSFMGEQRLLIPVKPAPNSLRSSWQSSLESVPSPDGETLYYARRLGELDLDAPARWTIVARNLASGEEREVIAGSGGRGTAEESYFHPFLSEDGQQLGYVMRDGGRSVLRVRNLATGRDVGLGETDHDALQASAWQGLLPRFDFTPDGKGVVLSHGGRFEIRPVDGAKARRLERRIRARVSVAKSTRASIAERDGPVLAKIAMGPTLSADGSKLAFVSLGGLYIRDDDSSLRRLGAAPDAPAQPGWRADGKNLVFVTWSEADGGAIWTLPTDESGPARQITRGSAFWRNPAYSPDGSAIYAFRSATDARRQASFEFGAVRPSELVRIELATGRLTVLAKGSFGGHIHFADGSDPYFLASGGLSRFDSADSAVKTVVRVTGPGWYFSEASGDASSVEISPDGEHVAAIVANRAYIMAVPTEPGQEIDVQSFAGGLNPLGDVSADFMVWSGSDQIELYSGTKWTRFDSGSGALLAEGRIQVSQPRAVPDGSILFAGGMAFTMANGDTIIDQADVLVTGNRIAAIGPSGTIRVPDGTVRRDVSGKIIMPGFIDVHDHIGSVRRDVPAYEDWGLRARLAYGVTTSFDPSTLSPDLLEYEGLVDIGKVLGPRLRSTGVAIMSKERFSSLEDVREVLDRYSSGYGIHNLKQYRAGDREVRQWIAKVSNEQELLPTTEGALSLKLDLTQILDGYAGNEHALPAWPLGDDVIALMVAMRTSYVTTLSTTNGGSPALNWFVPRDEFALDDRVRRFWSPAAIRQKMETVRPWRPLHTFRFPDDAGGAARLASAGGLVGMGGHGEAPGIGFHWELEAHAIGGMSPMAVLHAATAGSAETVGRLDDLGTLEAGKLADLVVLDANPLQDIRNTRHVVEVMRGGFLYEAATLAPVWPHPAPGPHAWFEGADVEQWLPVSTADLHDAHDH